MSKRSIQLISVGKDPLYLSLPSLGTSGAVLALFFLTIFHFWLAWFLPPSADELYYWSWAKSLQWSYFDHPPMVAYWIRASTAVFGDSVLSIRLPAILSSLLVFIALLFLAPREGLIWGLLFTPIALLGSVLMTPDIPLVFFWLLYSIWFAHSNASLDTWNQDPITRVYQNSPVGWSQWILGGVILGLGCLSKYTMFLAIPCGLLVLATRTRLRAWGTGYLVHLGVAGILLLPVLLYNWRLDFAPVLFQWNHANASSGFSFSQWFYYVGSQILLIGALPFVLFPWISARFRDLGADAKSHAYFWFFVLPFVFFLYKAFTVKLEANWPLVSYLTFWLVADRLLSWSSFRGLVRTVVILSFASAWIMSSLMLYHLFRPVAALQPRFDRVAVLEGQWATAQEVVNLIRETGYSSSFYAPNYQWVSYFRFLRVPTEQLGAERVSEFSIRASSPCPQTQSEQKEILTLELRDSFSPELTCFSKREVLKGFNVLSRGNPVSQVWLTRYSNS